MAMVSSLLRITAVSYTHLDVYKRQTLAQFFAEGDMVELTEEQKEMFAAWSSLSKDQKDVLQQLILVMKARG